MDRVSANGILGEKEQTIDVLVVGDSESFTSISPMQMWQKYGFTTYICGSSAQQLYEAYSFIRQAFERQKPSLVILETNAIFRNSNLSGHIMSRLEYDLPVLQYHNRWKSLSVNDFGSKVKYTWTDNYKGFFYNSSVAAANSDHYMEYTDAVAKIPRLNLYCLQNIIDFCDKHGAELLLVSTPSTINWNYSKHNAVQAFTNKHGIAYLDMNLLGSELGINWETDTYDKGDHLNYSGAVKVTTYLGQYLSQNYKLQDHREDTAYALWNNALKRYIHNIEEAG